MDRSEKDIGEIQKRLCNEKKVEIIEAEARPDHIHMPVGIPLYLRTAQFAGFLKEKSLLRRFDRHARYYVDTVGKNGKIIREIYEISRKKITCTISMKEYAAPFTGAKNK